MNSKDNECVDALKEIASALNDIRGVVYDLAPKKTLGENGEIVDESGGYLERLVRRAIRDNKVDKVLEDLESLESFVNEKKGFIHSSKETEYILNVIASKISYIRMEVLQNWK